MNYYILQAKENDVLVTNCGPCGACSNRDDVGRFRDLGDSMISTVAPCVVSYLVSSAGVARECMHRHVGLSRSCAACWVEDQGCLVAHCYYECVIKLETWFSAFKSRDNSKPQEAAWDDKNNRCLDCMETRCSKPYIDSCGANRRMAGVVSDISRSSEEICDKVNLWEGS